jgi:DNA-binding transcriptional MerR regulator
MTYSIRETAEITGFSKHTLRYYSDLSLFPYERDANNRRVFTTESLAWLEGIKCLKGCDLSLAEIKHYCDLCRATGDTLQERYQIFFDQRAVAITKLREAQRRLDYVNHKIAHYERVMAGTEPDDTNPNTTALAPRPD